MKRILLIVPIVVVGVLLALALGLRARFVSYLGSEACRVWLGETVSNALGVEAEFTRLQPQGLDAIYTDALTMKSVGHPLFKAEQLRADIRIGFWNRACEVDQIEITRARVSVPSEGWLGGSAQLGPSESLSGARGAWGAQDGSKSLAVHRLSVVDFGGSFGRHELKGMNLQVRVNPDQAGEWLYHGTGGILRLSTGQEWRMEGLEGRQRGGMLYMTASRLRYGERGEVKVTGEVSAQGGAEWRGTFSHIAMETVTSREHGFIPIDWRAQIVGELEGDFLVRSPQGGRGASRYEVQVALSNGEISALPVLDQVAKVTRVDGFQRMPLHKASAKVVQGEDGVVEVSNLKMESRGLLRVEGAFTVQDGQIDGTLLVGVPASVLQWVPGATEKVFTTTREGFVWTPVALSGLAAHPTEDLSARLLAAAAEESVRAVKESVRENAKGVLDVITPLVPVSLPKIPGLLE